METLSVGGYWLTLILVLAAVAGLVAYGRMARGGRRPLFPEIGRAAGRDEDERNDAGFMQEPHEKRDQR